MGKSMRSKAHRHKRTKRRERAQGHYDKLLEERAEVARKHLEQAQPVRDDEAKVAEQVERKRERERALKEEKRRARAGMQWEAMKPIDPTAGASTSAGDVAMDDASGGHNLRSRSRVRDPSKARTPLQGGKLIGVRKKTTKKERKNVKKRLKRHK